MPGKTENNICQVNHNKLQNEVNHNYPFLSETAVFTHKVNYIMM